MRRLNPPFIERRRQAAKAKAIREREQHEKKPIKEILRAPWNWNAVGTCVMAVLTAGLVAIGFLQYCVYSRQTEIMQHQDAIQSAQQRDERFVNRAWVKAEIVPAAVKYDINGANFSVELHLKNVGHSPADRVWSFMWVDDPVIACASSPCKSFDPLQTHLSAMKRLGSDSTGYLLLPEDTLPQITTATISSQDLKNLATRIGTIRPFATIIIQYRMPLDDSLHQTCYVFEIRRQREASGKHPNSPAIWIDDGDIQAEDLSFVFSPILGSCSS